MKFSEMPYTRPNLDALAQASAQAVAALDGAETAQAQLEACRVYQETADQVATQCNIAYIRHTIDTRDAFYEAEQDFIDEAMPKIQA